MIRALTRLTETLAAPLAEASKYSFTLAGSDSISSGVHLEAKFLEGGVYDLGTLGQVFMLLEEEGAVVAVEEVCKGKLLAFGSGVLSEESSLWLGYSISVNGVMGGPEVQSRDGMLFPFPVDRFSKGLHEEDKQYGGHIVTLLYSCGIWYLMLLEADGKSDIHLPVYLLDALD